MVSPEGDSDLAQRGSAGGTPVTTFSPFRGGRFEREEYRP